jgi:hypothetical protein
MNAQELRLGSIVFKHDVYYTIKWYDFEDSEQDSDMGLYYKPIPLTPEILDKVGFKHNENMCSWDLVINSGLLAIDDTDFSIAIFNNHSELGFAGSNKSSVKSVHRLQNIYFALTGEELNITL